MTIETITGWEQCGRCGYRVSFPTAVVTTDGEYYETPDGRDAWDRLTEMQARLADRALARMDAHLIDCPGPGGTPHAPPPGPPPGG